MTCCNDVRHVVLVHGTWGHGLWRSLLWSWLPDLQRQKDVSWPICKQMREAGLALHSFSWSGRNSHRERLHATNELAAFIQSIPVGPHDRVSIVAHSHGGNVALGALRHLRNGEIDSVICLATPFLHVDVRVIDSDLFRWLPFATTYSSMIFALLMFLLLAFGGLLLAVAIAVLFVAIGVLLGVFAAKFMRRVLEQSPSSIQAACEKYDTTPDQGQRLLIVRKIGDEASGALAAGWAVEWFSLILWKLLSGLVVPLTRIIRLVEAVIFGGHHAQARVVLSLMVIFGLFITFPAARVLIPILLAIAAVIVAGCIAQLVLLALVFLVNGFRFGFENPLLRVAAEATPKGVWEINLLPATGFAHSEIYTDSSVGEILIRWILSDSGELPSGATGMNKPLQPTSRSGIST